MSSAAIASTRFAPVRTLLQANVAALSAIAGAIFAFAEGAPLAALTIPIALCGFLWTDYRQSFALNAWMANGLGFLAFAAAGSEFFGGSIEGRLLAFGHLLLYLTWILLLQKKGTPQFWWLCALSVLQVATSSVLTSDIWFGLSLMAYVLFALWTMSVFTLDRAVQRSTQIEPSSVTDRSSIAAHSSVSRNASRRDRSAGWITPRLVAGVLINGVLSILVGLTFFVFTPRVWLGGPAFLTPSTDAAVRSVTGYTEQVSVGDMGEILENHDLVFEVKFSSTEAGAGLDVNEYAARLGDDAPLFRGAVLGDYDNGRWSAIESGLKRSARRGLLRRGQRLVEQHYRLSSPAIDALFTCGSTITCLPDDRLSPFDVDHEPLGNTFRRTSGADRPSNRMEPFEYTAYALAGERRRLWEIDPQVEQQYLRMMSRLPEETRSIRDLAHSVLESSRVQDASQTEIAKQFVTLLRDSGEYKYSLDLSIDDPTIDPVADFLLNRRRGHCEYFASALVLMLRSAGIPARYVTGFKGGDVDKFTGLTQIRQLHAHAWAEAYVDGEWKVLDPTPAARDRAVNEISEASHFWTDVASRAQQMWSRGMMMSGDEQRQLFLNPLEDSTSGFFETLKTLVTTWTLPGAATTGAASTSSVIGRVVTGFAALALVAACLMWMLKRGRGTFGRRRGAAPSRSERAVPTVAFYERFRSILARSGHERGDAQTPLEFAGTVDRHLVTRGLSNGVSHLPAALTSAFYHVRYGSHVLPPGQIEELNTSLNKLERSLSNGET